MFSFSQTVKLQCFYIVIVCRLTSQPLLVRCFFCALVQTPANSTVFVSLQSPEGMHCTPPSVGIHPGPSWLSYCGLYPVLFSWCIPFLLVEIQFLFMKCDSFASHHSPTTADPENRPSEFRKVVFQPHAGSMSICLKIGYSRIPSFVINCPIQIAILRVSICRQSRVS